MSGTITLYADFNNADARGRLRLNCKGTLDDLAAAGKNLEEGLEVTLTDGELRVDGTVVASKEEGIWVAVVDWDKVTSC